MRLKDIFVSCVTMSKESTVYWPKINNVKARFRVHPSEIDSLRRAVLTFSIEADKSFINSRNSKKKRRKEVFKQYHNFVVIREKHTYIIFTNKGVVNITGIRCICLMPEAVKDFCLKFCVDVGKISQPIIDNITATGNFGRPINLLKLRQLINKKEINSNITSVTSNADHFPSAFCRTVGSATCSIFQKGVYNIIGAKCREDIQELMKHMAVLIQRL